MYTYGTISTLIARGNNNNNNNGTDDVNAIKLRRGVYLRLSAQGVYNNSNSINNYDNYVYTTR